MKHDDIFLRHILECVLNIEEYTREGAREFYSSKMIQDAVIRNLEIIGEATKRVSEELKA